MINCAAWTDVDGAEDAEDGAMLVNDTGAACSPPRPPSGGRRSSTSPAITSSDGQQRRPYVESDLTEPISAYGRSKQAGETSTADANPFHLIVRSSWLYGAHGHNFVETMLRLAGEQPEVIVVSDQVGSPTYTRHLAPALAELAEGEEWGIHHVAASGRCSWFDFAQEIFDQAEIRMPGHGRHHRDARAPGASAAVLGPRLGATNAPRRFPTGAQGLREYLRERKKVPA